MKKFQHIFCVVVALVCLMATQSCSDDKTETKHQVSVSDSEMNLIVTSEQKTFTITSKIDWRITSPGLTGTNGGWYTLSAASGNSNTEITVKVKANPTGQPRIATLTVKGKFNEVTVTLTQAADGDGMLDVEPALLEDFNVRDAVTQTFNITTPFEWTITFEDKTTYTDPLNPAIDPQWASVDVVGGEGDKTITVTAKDNDTGNARTGEFTITAAGKPKTVTVNQLNDLNNSFDPLFFAWCIDPANGKVDTNGDGLISILEAEAVAKIHCYYQSLTSLKGIESFTNLAQLRCNNNSLTELDLSKNTKLTVLDCYSNNLSTINVSNSTELTVIECYDNNLTELDLSKSTKLTALQCYNNKLSTLDVSKNTALTALQCYNNNLSTLDLSKSTALTELSCRNNDLSTLDVSKNTELTELICNTNPSLATINISGSSFGKLTKFDCTTIKAESRVYVWSGFNINDKPSASDWKYPQDVTWEVPNLNHTFDPAFLAFCLASWNDIDTNHDGYITKEEAEAITYLHCAGGSYTSLKGIENFTNLTMLRCYDNQLTALDLSKNTKLTWLFCSRNPLSTLDLSKNTELTDLICSDNNLSTLDLSKNTKLTWIECDTTKLSTLDLSKNTALHSLHCGSNTKLSTLDLSKNTELYRLNCGNNTNLSTLDLSKNTALYSLHCSSNTKLSTLDLSKNTALYRLDCSENSLTSLDLSNNTALTNIDCHNNKLSTLDVSKNTALYLLNCSTNLLTSLDVSKNTALTGLYCNNNNLSTLDASKNTALYNLICHANPSLATIDISSLSFSRLSSFSCKDIKAKATVFIWDGFKTTNIPQYWNYPEDIIWMFPILNHTLDSDFLAWCLDPAKGNVDTNGDGYITKLEAEAVTIINCNNRSLTSLKGIENFTNLTELQCDRNNLPSLDVSKNTKLTWLNCGTNQLTSLDVSKNTALTNLNCGTNKLSTIDVSKNTKLTVLWCDTNNLSAIELSKNRALTELWCHSNHSLATIDISGSSFATLTNLNCQSIKAGAEIYVWSGFNINSKPAKSDWRYPTGITWVFPDLNHTFDSAFLGWCLDPAKGKIDTNGNGAITKNEAEAVTIIHCDNQLLASLKGIENFTNITDLRCYDNQLTALDLSKNTKLTVLHCGFNNLTSLDVNENTALTKLLCSYNTNLSTINISGSSFATLKLFHCPGIKSGAKVIVWDRFNIANKPAASDWYYPEGIIWAPPYDIGEPPLPYNR